MPDQAPRPGVRIRVRGSRSCASPRTGTVVDVRAFEAISEGLVIVVQWDDGESVSWVAPGAPFEVIEG